jgi:hypothetical protein
MYLPELRLGLNTRLLDWKRNSPFRNCKFSDCDPLAIFIRTIDPSTAPPMCCVHCKAVLREEISKVNSSGKLRIYINVLLFSLSFA